MDTPLPPSSGERGADLHRGSGTLTKTGCKSPLIIVDGCCVRILTDADVGVPKRQSFAWETNARDYAERLSIERGWKLERG